MAEIILEVQDGNHSVVSAKPKKNTLKNKLLRLSRFFRKYEKAIVNTEDYEIRVGK